MLLLLCFCCRKRLRSVGKLYNSRFEIVNNKLKSFCLFSSNELDFSEQTNVLRFFYLLFLFDLYRSRKPLRCQIQTQGLIWSWIGNGHQSGSWSGCGLKATKAFLAMERSMLECSALRNKSGQDAFFLRSILWHVYSDEPNGTSPKHGQGGLSDGLPFFHTNDIWSRAVLSR